MNPMMKLYDHLHIIRQTIFGLIPTENAGVVASGLLRLIGTGTSDCLSLQVGSIKPKADYITVLGISGLLDGTIVQLKDLFLLWLCKLTNKNAALRGQNSILPSIV
jgi:hypothetical protein